MRILARSLFLCASLYLCGNVIAANTVNEVKYPGIIAKVGDEIITSSDLDKSVALSILSMGGAYSPDMREQVLRDTLEEMISGVLKWKITQKFAPTGGWVSEKEVDDQIANIASLNKLNVQQFYELMKKSKVDKNVLRRHIRINIAWRKYIEARYGRVSVTDFEVRNLKRKFEQSKGKRLYEIARAFFSIDNSQDEARVMKIVNDKKILTERAGYISNVAGRSNVEVVLESLLPPKLQRILSVTPVGKCAVYREGNIVQLVYVKDMYQGQNSYTKLKIIQIAIPDNSEHPTKEDIRNQMNFARDLIKASSSVNALIENAKASGLCAISPLVDVVLDQVDFDVRKVLAATPAGRASEPVRTPQSVSIFCVKEKQTHERKLPTSDEVRNVLRDDKLNKHGEAELQNERKRSEIKIFSRSLGGRG